MHLATLHICLMSKKGFEILHSAPDHHLLLAAAIRPLLLCSGPSFSAAHLCQFQCCMIEAAPEHYLYTLSSDTLIEPCIINTGHRAGFGAPSRSAHRARGSYDRARAEISAAELQDLSLQHADDTPQSHSHATCCSATSG